ncbi:MAG: T9SS type A sorting domain-containing protein [Bacteroidetes bacterium]|nr:T9SS type A sorting domain-containing protein [Bacteroidota bacterium]
MRKIFLIHFIVFSVTLFGQAPKRFFTKFGGYGVDIGYSGKPTLDRHYIVSGSTSSYGAGNTDVYLVKVDSMGFPIWEKTFGGFGNDVGRSVIQLPDSGYVIAGFTNSFGAGGYDAYIVKTDKNGNLIWQKTFGGLDWDFAYDLVLAPDGDIIVCGNTSSSGAGKKDGLLLKYDLLGNLVWQKTIGGIENEELRSVIKTNDNFLATVGYTESNGDINGDVYFYKFDLGGNTIFYNITGGPGKDYANDIVQKFNNDYVICGAKTFTVDPDPIGLMYSMSSTGAFLWEYYDLLSVGKNEFFSVTNSYQNTGFNAYVRSRPISGFKLQADMYIGLYMGYNYKLNASGGSEDEYVYSVEALADGGFVSVGSTLSFGSIGEDVYLIRHDSTVYNYSSVVGVKENPKNKKPYIFQNDDKVNVFFTDKNVSSLELIDINGKIINTFLIRQEEEELKIDVTQIPGSVYFMRVRFKDGQIYNKKLIIN